MKTANKAYRRERVSFKDYLFAMAGIKLPWFFLALALLATVGSTFATMNIATFNGAVIDEMGNVPTENVLSYACSYLLIAIASAATLVLSAIASEKINLGLRSRLWRKIIYTRQSCYDMDGGESLVSRVTADCDFASKLLATLISMVGIAIGMGIYIARINTVSEYEAYVREQKTLETLFNINYYMMESILGDYPVESFDEDDIRILGELEADNFKKLFLEKEGIDLTKEVPQGWRDQGVNSLDEFIAARREWYKVKITQCLIYLNILNVPCEGKNDPLDHYEVLSELQMKAIELIKKELERRN